VVVVGLADAFGRVASRARCGDSVLQRLRRHLGSAGGHRERDGGACQTAAPARVSKMTDTTFAVPEASILVTECRPLVACFPREPSRTPTPGAVFVRDLRFSGIEAKRRG